MPCVGFAQHIEEAVHEVAAKSGSASHPQRLRLVVAQGLVDLTPIEVAR